MQHLLAESPHSPRFVKSSALSQPPRRLTPYSTSQLPAQRLVGCMDQRLRVLARCTAVTPYSLSCSCYGELRPWPTRERVLLDLSRDEGAKNCCGSPSPSGSTICASGMAIPSRPWIIFRIDRGLPDHLACGSA